MMRQFLPAISLSLALMSCDRSPEIRVVSNHEYAIDKSCWGGEDGRYKGVGVFSGDDVKSFFILSNNCSTKDSGYRFSAFINLGLVRIHDKDQLISKKVGGVLQVSDNFVHAAVPSEKELLYLSDIRLRKKESDGFVYFEVVQVERLEATNMNVEDLLGDFKGTMRKLRELEDSH